MLGALGVGGPTVDTVLSSPHTYPGGLLSGQVELVGGGQSLEIEHITLSLVAGEESEGEQATAGEFHRTTVGGPLHLAAGQQLSVPFELELPWETPLTAVYGRPLPKMMMGVHTEVVIARAVDKGDLDPILVNPLPVQLRILDALADLGFVLLGADLEYDRTPTSPRGLPFHQRIGYGAAPRYAQAVTELALTFVTGPDTIEVILEPDRQPSDGGRFTVGHGRIDETDWTRQVDTWIRQSLGHRQADHAHG